MRAEHDPGALDGGSLAVERRARRRLVLLLSLGGPLGFLGALPYFLPLIRQLLDEEAARGGVHRSLAGPLAAQLVQVSLLTAVAAWGGARLRGRTGFDAPWVRAWAERRAAPRSFLAELPRALLVGAGFSVAILAVNHFASPFLPSALREAAGPGANLGEKAASFFRGASSAFYGGIIEELLMRWGLLSLLIALLGLGRSAAGARAIAGAQFWSANLFCGLLFGAGHLPLVFKLVAHPSALTVSYIVVSNALAGLCCGWMLWRRGLEPAMVAHGFGDVCLHALPLVVPFLAS